MSDFTKEELEGLMLCVIHSSWLYKANKHDVIKKLEYMIENYCKHSNTKGVSEMDMDYRAICKDCGVLL